MGGEIGIESETGKGTTFWFTAKVKKQAKIEAPIKVAKSLGDQRVLVVDNNASTCYLLSSLLDQWKCPHDEVNSAKQCFEKLKTATKNRNPFSIIILDKQLSDMDSGDLGKKILAAPEIVDPHLILMTAIGERGESVY